MSRRFEIGDRVKVIAPLSRHYGEHAVVVKTATAQRTEIWPTGDSWRHGETIYLLDIAESPHSFASYRILAPIYDGNEKVSWSSCEWMPKGARA